MADPAQDFLDSGGVTAHPLDAANDAAAPSADPAQAFLDSGGAAPHPLKKTDSAKAPGSVATALEGPLQAAGSAVMSLGPNFVNGVNSLANRITGGHWNQSPLSTMQSGAAGQHWLQQLAELPGVHQLIDAVHSGDTAIAGATKNHPIVQDVLQQTAGTLGDVGKILPVVTGPETDLGELASRLRPAASPPVPPGLPASTPRALVPSGTSTRSLPALTSTGAPAPKLLPAPELTASGAERPAYFDPQDPQSAQTLGIKPEKAETPDQPASTGNLTPDQIAQRTALAQRLGLKEVRTSAIEGDAQAAADDYDSTKYTDEPMGARMRPLIQSERKALVDSGNSIVGDTEARAGTDQSARKANGKALAAPMDMLQDHIENATNEAYEAAKAEKGDTPITLPKLQAALSDSTLRNTLLAQGKEGFLTGAQSQLDDFNRTNPDGLTVAHAEQYRQFLNTLWKTNPHAVGTLKDALDSDVAGQVGSDVFAPARQLHQLGKVLLENPKGVSQTFGKDPMTPVNRSTAYEDIPDKLMDLPSDQFNNVLNTYRMMPEELQPQAQKAISTLQGHAVNRIVDAGSKTELQWNKNAVNNELADNSENYQNLFADRPDLASRIQDIKDGGEMLRFNSSYRGAHAQASNMIKKGIGAGAEWAGAGAGAGIGTFLAGPGVGTTVGAMAGKAAVGKGLNSVSSALAKRAVEARVTKLGTP